MAAKAKQPAEKSATTSPAPKSKRKNPTIELPKDQAITVSSEITITAPSNAPKDWALSDAKYQRRTGAMAFANGEPGEVVDLTVDGQVKAQGVVVDNELEEGPRTKTHPVVEVVKIRITEIVE